MASARSAQVQRCVARLACGAEVPPVLGNTVIGDVQTVVNHVTDDLDEAVALGACGSVLRLNGTCLCFRVVHGRKPILWLRRKRPFATAR